MNHLEWNHFGRKNVGYMYAIHQGANLIYDFDDDNHLRLPVGNFLFRQIIDGTVSAEKVVTQHHLFNPYPMYKPVHDGETAFVWPRGFPLGFIQDEGTYVCSSEAADSESVAVFQSLANNDPDVDAIYRLTQQLPLTFSKEGRVLIVPEGTFSPWNAQAVLVKRSAFWGLLLPVSVHGRVSDIWRSYITQRLLWEAQQAVAFTSPFVDQFRNPHDYTEDFAFETPLYLKAPQLLAILSGFSSPLTEALSDAWLRLMGELVTAGVLETKDLSLARAWAQDLESVGYVWPVHTLSNIPFVPPATKTLDFRVQSLPLAVPPQAALPPATASAAAGAAAGGGSLFLFIGTVSRAANFGRRKAIRDGWLQWRTDLPTRLTVENRFITERSGNREMDTLLEAEMREHGDLIIGDFPAEKGWMLQRAKVGMTEAVQLFPGLEYYLRLDDDCFVCLDKLVAQLEVFPRTQLLWGKYWRKGNGCISRMDEQFLLFSRDVLDHFLGNMNDPVTIKFDGKTTFALNVGLWTMTMNLTIFDDRQLIDSQQGYITNYMRKWDPANAGKVAGFCDKHIISHHSHEELVLKAYNATVAKCEGAVFHQKRRDWAMEGRKQLKQWKVPPKTCRKLTINDSTITFK